MQPYIKTWEALAHVCPQPLPPQSAKSQHYICIQLYPTTRKCLYPTLYFNMCKVTTLYMYPTTRMHNSTVRPLCVTKNHGNFYSYCISKIWPTTFPKSLGFSENVQMFGRFLKKKNSHIFFLIFLAVHNSSIGLIVCPSVCYH